MISKIAETTIFIVDRETALRRYQGECVLLVQKHNRIVKSNIVKMDGPHIWKPEFKLLALCR